MSVEHTFPSVGSCFCSCCRYAWVHKVTRQNWSLQCNSWWAKSHPPPLLDLYRSMESAFIPTLELYLPEWVPHLWFLFLRWFWTKYSFGFYFYAPLFKNLLFRATPAAFGSSQTRGLIGAVAAGLCHNHSNAKSELHRWPTPQLTASQILNPLSKARDQTCILVNPSRVHYCWARTELPYAPPFERSQTQMHWDLAQETHLDVLPRCAQNRATSHLWKLCFACVSTLCGGFSQKRVWAGLANQFNRPKRPVIDVRGAHFKAETYFVVSIPSIPKTWNCKFLKIMLDIHLSFLCECAPLKTMILS